MNTATQCGLILMFVAFYAKSTGGPGWIDPDPVFTLGAAVALMGNVIDNLTALGKMIFKTDDN